MLKLIKCEFLKLKRKKFIPLIILAAFLFPIPLTYLMTTPSMMERYTDRADAFDGLFNMVLGYGNGWHPAADRRSDFCHSPSMALYRPSLGGCVWMTDGSSELSGFQKRRRLKHTVS